MTLQEQIQTIAKQKNLSVEDIQNKIKEKMNSLGNLISEEGALHIIANELGVSLHEDVSSELTISELTPQLRNVTFFAKVLQKYEMRTFGEGGKVGNIFVGDASGFTRVTFWNEKTTFFENLKEGDVIQVQNAYTKENNGRIEVHMGNASNCVINPEGKTIEVKERSGSMTAQEKKLVDITAEDSVVSITATIVQVYDPRFFESCPVCNKRLREENGSFVCAEHGPQEPTYNYVLNAFLDDGTDTIRGTLWKEQIQKLFSKSNEDIISLRENTAALEDLKTDVLGQIIKARGKIKINEQYDTKEIVLYEIDVQPHPDLSSSQELPTSEEKKPVKKEEPVQDSLVSEEVFDEDDEDLLSLDDLEEEL